VELVGQYIALKKRGREFLGLCPFHDDKRPSLNVSPGKQIFKCFSCGAGGGVFQFLMLYDKASFPEAVRSLAERANIPLPRDGAPQPSDGGISKNDLVDVMTFAARFYRDCLDSPSGTAALEYARMRGLTDESIRRFGLGYAPDSWEALTSAALKKGYNQSQLVAAGLVSRREKGTGCYDRFRNRLIFPIFDPSGRVVAFGGRSMSDEDRAKYLNSPETILFDKSSQLYAMNWSRESIVSTGQAIVVEGYLDALMPIQGGVGNVVATLGTALTEQHVRLLSRYAREAVLIFDADEAGASAAQRALETFLAQQVHVRVATIPSGKDPCDFMLSAGADAMRELVSGAPDALQYVWNQKHAAIQDAGDDLAYRRRMVEEFLQLVVSSAAYGAIDEVRRGQLAQHIGHMLNISPGDLIGQMRRLGRRISRRASAEAPARLDQGTASGAAMAERNLLEVLLNCPELFATAAERATPDDVRDPDLRRLADRLWQSSQQGRSALEDILASDDLASLGSLAAELATVGERRGNYEHTLNGALDCLAARRNSEELQRLKQSGLSDDTLRRVGEHHSRPDARRHPKIT
jgi:DNA primase